MLSVLPKQLFTSFRLKNLKKYNILQILLVIFRLIPCYFLIGYDIFFQTYIVPMIFISYIRRYISSITNLCCLRLVLFLFGIVRFQSQNLHYFNCNKSKLRFNSGHIGVSSNTNFIDFLYLSCTFNPIFVRMVQFHDPQNTNHINNNIRLLFVPLSFKQAFHASLVYHGFDPIVIKSKEEFRKLKLRKVQMSSFLNESDQQKLGPIIVFLPQVSENQILSINKKLYKGIEQNQRFNGRYAQAFNIKINKIIKSQDQQKQKIKIFSRNQLNIMLHLCSKLKRYQLYIKANLISTSNFYSHYLNKTHQQITDIDQFYKERGFTILDLTYSQYLNIKNKKQEMIDSTNEKKSINNKYENYKRKDVKKQQEQQPQIKIGFKKKFDKQTDKKSNYNSKNNMRGNKIKIF